MQSEKPSCLSHNKIARIQEVVWDDMGSTEHVNNTAFEPLMPTSYKM